MIGKALMHYETISDRITLLRLQATPVNMLVIQVYAPCEDEKDDKKDKFYEMLDQVIADNRKGRECLIVMGDFNGKVGENKEEDIVGPFGLGSIGMRMDNMWWTSAQGISCMLQTRGFNRRYLHSIPGYHQTV